MNPEIFATSKTPALVLYLIDISASMNRVLGNETRISVVRKALSEALKEMIRSSTKGSIIIPKYRVGLIAYSDDVYDILGGIKTIDQVARIKIPDLSPQSKTNTARAFSYVLQILQKELPNIQNCLPPLICHMTDGEYSENDPEPIAKEIMNTGTSYGSTLIENIYISDDLFGSEVIEISEWSGIRPTTRLTTDYAHKLRNISSPIPKSYHNKVLEAGYRIAENAVMLFPGSNPEIIKLGFNVTAAAPLALSRKSYQNRASSRKQALVIFLIDLSHSMEESFIEKKTKLEATEEILRNTITKMIGRSLKQNVILPRYRVGIIGYSNDVYDILDGVKTVDIIADKGIPKLHTLNKTNTAKGFRYVMKMLLEEKQRLSAQDLEETPVPLVIHITDAKFNEKFEDPDPIINEIQQISFPDGNVLIENLYLSDEFDLKTHNIEAWDGFLPNEDLGIPYANKLLHMSSLLPETYRIELNSMGLKIQPGATMMIPGIFSDFISMAFSTSRMSSVATRDTRLVWEDD